MNDYILSSKALLKTVGSSKGAQPKYLDGGFWYKEDHTGYEGLSEYLVTLVLECSDIPYYVQYEQCTVNGKCGCRSLDFTGPREIFLSFQRLFDLYRGGELEGFLSTLNDPKERIDFTLRFVNDITGLDVTKYVSETLSLDYLICNPDRHMNNLGVIADQDTGNYRIAPIFDNGAALLSDVSRYPYDIPFEKHIESIAGRPFSSNLGLQAMTAGFDLKIDYDKLYDILSREPDSRALQVLKYQLGKLEKIFRK